MMSLLLLSLSLGMLWVGGFQLIPQSAKQIRLLPKLSVGNIVMVDKENIGTTPPFVRKAVVSAVVSLSLAASSLPHIVNTARATDTAVVTTSASAGAGLEQAMEHLESSSTRADAVQALADVYEAAGSKTLLARTKYKYRIIAAVNEKRLQLNNEWDQALRYETGELKRRVDPFRTVDLAGYLKIAPIVGGLCYLGALFIQQTLPELFFFGYPIAVFVFVAPILYTVIFS